MKKFNLQGLEKFQKYFKSKNYYSQKTESLRKVNQREMFEFIKLNPGVTETELQINLYNYSRSRYEAGCVTGSNKKYAECLRRLLDSGKISREKIKGKYVYTITKENWEDSKPKFEFEVVGNFCNEETNDIPQHDESYDKLINQIDMMMLVCTPGSDGKVYVTKANIADILGVSIEDLFIIS